MSTPSISVIVAAHRAARMIGRAVASVLDQTHLPDEILVIDDGNPDDIAPALKPYRDWIKLLRKPSGGASSARNLGMERAGGALFAFLDADDYWEPTKLAQQIDVFQRHGDVGLVASRYYEETPDRPRVAVGEENDRDCGRLLRANDDGLAAMVPKIWTSTVVVRREVVGDHRFVTGLEPAEDRDMWVRLAARRPAYILPERLATAGVEPGTLSPADVERNRSHMLEVIQRHAGLLGARQQRTWEARVYRAWAAEHLGSNQPRQALSPAWHRLRRQPLALEAWYVLLKGALKTCRSVA